MSNIKVGGCEVSGFCHVVTEAFAFHDDYGCTYDDTDERTFCKRQ